MRAKCIQFIVSVVFFNSILKAQVVNISYKGSAPSGWVYTTKSGPQNVSNYEVYYANRPARNEAHDEALFFQLLGGPGGVFIGANTGRPDSFYSTYVNDRLYSEYLAYNQSQQRSGKGFIDRSKYFEIKYPNGKAPGISEQKIAGKRALIYYDDESEQTKRTYYIFLFLDTSVQLKSF